MPKLIYLKESTAREPKLAALLDRIKADDTVSYASYSTPEQLAERLTADLATLLAERFDGARSEPADVAREAVRRVPAPYTEAIGREDDVSALLDLIARDGVRLVTLVGPGGIGKSRLAIEVAQRMATLPRRGRGIRPLEHVTDPGRMVPAIAAELGVRDSGRGDPASDIGRAAGDRRMLIVLDNFEQVLDAAPLIVRLFTELPEATFLVTSRARLRLRGEHVFDVEPLGAARSLPCAARGDRDRLPRRAALPRPRPGREPAVRRHAGEHRGGGAGLRVPGRRSPGDRARGRAHPAAVAGSHGRPAGSATPAPGGRSP